MCKCSDSEMREAVECALTVAVVIFMPPGLKGSVPRSHDDIARDESRPEICGKARRRIRDTTAHASNIEVAKWCPSISDHPGGGMQVERQHSKQGRFPAPIWPENHPAVSGQKI
jgi:hypothetical protein